MSAIWIDPVELAETSQLLSGLAGQVAELGGGLFAGCCCELPSDVAAELDSVRLAAADVGASYETAALDLGQRADLIGADQTLVTAASAAYGLAVSAAPSGESSVDFSGWTGAMDQPSSQPAAATDFAGWTGGLGSAPSAPAGSVSGADTNTWMSGMAAANLQPSPIDTSGWAGQIHGVTGSAGASALGLGAGSAADFSTISNVAAGVAVANSTADLQAHGTEVGLVYTDASGNSNTNPQSGYSVNGHTYLDPQ